MLSLSKIRRGERPLPPSRRSAVLSKTRHFAGRVGRTTLAVNSFHLSYFRARSLCVLCERVEDPRWRTVKFFVNICLYFVCRRFAAENSHRLRRALCVLWGKILYSTSPHLGILVYKNI